MTGKRAGFFCKSFRPDFDHVQVMLRSFMRHNPDNLHLFFSIPKSDISYFRNRFGFKVDNLTLVADEAYCGHDLTRYRGWHGQQICKLNSDRAADLDHFVVLDSDCYFVSDVHADDIVPRQGDLYVACGSLIRTVVSPENTKLNEYIVSDNPPGEDSFPPRNRVAGNDHLAAYVAYREFDADNPDALSRSDIPFKVFGSARWFYFQPGHIFSAGALRALREFFKSRKLSAADAICISPWEYNWYGEFLAAMFAAQTDFRVSPFLHFPDEASLKWAVSSGLTLTSVAKKFRFVAMAARHMSQLEFVERN